MSRIVLIEDDDGIAEMLCFNLELAGHQVLVAGDGPSGLRLATSGAPDVVLLDLDLRSPGVGGMEVARRLRETGTAPVIVLTGREDSELDAVAELGLGAAAIVPKPFSVHRLLACIDWELRADLSAPNAKGLAATRPPGGPRTF